MIGRDGSTAGVYRKVHLVPFGEYVPMKDVLFFAAPLVQAVSDFSPGTDVVTLPIAAGSVSTAICYEVVYPSLIRDGVLRGQPAADDDHERRLVRPIVGAVAALRDGLDARDRGGPVSGPRGQYRRERHRGSRTDACGSPRISS